MGDKKATVLLTDNHALILQGLQSVIAKMPRDRKGMYCFVWK